MIRMMKPVTYTEQVHDASSLGVIAQFEIARLVPIGSSRTFADLAAQTGIDEDRLSMKPCARCLERSFLLISTRSARILRYAMLNYIFREEPAGHVRHTMLSAHLSQSPNFCDFLRTIALVFNPANVSLPVALSKWSSTQSMRETGHCVARGTDKVFYDWLDGNVELRDNFDRGMEGISRGGQRLQDTDLRAYPWAELPENAKVVDMGGSGKFMVPSVHLP